MAPVDLKKLLAWTTVPPPRFVGGNTLELLLGGDALFPRMEHAIHAAQRDIWLATYIFHNDPAGERIAQSLRNAAARGVDVHVVVDGFGTLGSMGWLREQFAGSAVQLVVFRPLDRWYAWLQPGQLRRLHQKLCVCDGTLAFVGGVNLIDDRHDIHHGWGAEPRLDYSVQLSGPLAQAVHDTARAMWARAQLWRSWTGEMQQLRRSPHKVGHVVDRVKTITRQLRGNPVEATTLPVPTPVVAAFLVRDNLRQRRTIERSFVEAIRHAESRVDIAVPYFYPGHSFRRALRGAAKRGVQVRLLLQGKVDYRIAALAARALYDELRGRGVRIYEYTPAFLHAKVAVVDQQWATVGSSNIDPLSLLLNLEANVVVRDPGFCADLGASLETAFAAATEVTGATRHTGWRRWLHRGAVAWMANVYLRVAGITGRY